LSRERHRRILFGVKSTAYAVVTAALTLAAAAASLERPACADAVSGRSIFVARCASCHNERGDKPLPSGPPLSKRKLTADQITTIVSSRLRGASEEERHAVAQYIASLLTPAPNMKSCRETDGWMPHAE
jgi:mono/diheme cytochrome c family protein